MIGFLLAQAANLVFILPHRLPVANLGLERLISGVPLNIALNPSGLFPHLQMFENTVVRDVKGVAISRMVAFACSINSATISGRKGCAKV